MPKAHLFSLLIPNNVNEVLVILVNLLLFFEDEDLNFKWFYLRDRVAIINDKIKNKEIFMLSRLKTLFNLDYIPKLKTVSLLLLKIEIFKIKQMRYKKDIINFILNINFVINYIIKIINY